MVDGGGDGGERDTLAAMADRIDTLEVKIAYQDEIIEDLNTAIVAQWSKLDHLQRLVESLQDRLKDLQDRTPGEPQDEPPPPHY